jgi:GNAT superfamily N-acetyltransferase
MRMELRDGRAWARVRPLYDALDRHLAPQAVLAGSEPGRVWADDPDAPQSACVQAGRRVYVGGAPAEGELRAALRAHLHAATAHQPLVLYEAGAAEAALLTPPLAGRRVERLRRQHYTLNIGEAEPRATGHVPPLPPGMVLRPVDRTLLAETHLGHLDALRAELVSECPSVEFFLAHRFGVCLVGTTEVVAWCLAEHTVGDRCEVGIETRPAYRRRGWATVVARAWADAAAARGIIQVGWHCYADNAGSIATARKVGFQPEGDYQVCVVRPAPA